MDDRKTRQVALLLEHARHTALDACRKEIRAIHDEHAGKGRLQSGATIKRSVGVADRHFSSFISSAPDTILSLTKEQSAFELLRAETNGLIGDVWTLIDHSITLATGHKRAQFQSVVDGAQTLFAEARARLLRQLEIRSFQFSDTELPEQSANPDFETTPRRNNGGKPLGGHWDAMWADIAVKLWTGELQPTRQKDISAAMFDWLNERELEAGETAVTGRARALWQRIEATRFKS